MQITFPGEQDTLRPSLQVEYYRTTTAWYPRYPGTNTTTGTITTTTISSTNVDMDIITEASTEIIQDIPVEVIWDAFTIFKAIILTIIVLGTIIGNALVLIAVFTNRNKNLRSSTHWFIANLATADLFVGILVHPFLAVLTITGNWYFGQIYCVLWAYIHFWLCSASILSVCAICIDRFIGVSFPLKHYRLMNKRKVFYISCCVWLTALGLSSIPLAVWPEEADPNYYVCKINQQLGHVLVASFLILYIPTVIMLVLYGKIFMITLEHFRIMREGLFQADRLHKGQDGGGDGGHSSSNSSNVTGSSSVHYNSNSSNNGNSSHDEFSSSSSSSGASVKVKTSRTDSSESKQEQKPGLIKKANNGNGIPYGKSSFKSYVNNGPSKITVEQNQLALTRARQVRVATKLALVVGAFIFSYVPFFTVFLINALWPGTISVPVFFFFGWIRYFNSCLNPIIYAAMLPAFTKAFKNILTCNFRR